MIFIQKQHEPLDFTEYRLSLNASYEGLPKETKDALRKSLLSEQGWLCAYCMTRISEEKMKIEHWAPQTCVPERQLDYSNLLGVCKGNEGERETKQHCDTKKGNKRLQLNPSNPTDHPKLRITYKANGEISSNDDNFKQELDNVLNLNCNVLKDNRHGALQGFRRALKQRGKKISKDRLCKDLDEAQTKQEKGFKPYTGIIRYYLDKKIKRSE